MKYRLAFLSIFAGLSLSACVTNSDVYIDESAITILPEDAAVGYLQDIVQEYRGGYEFKCIIGETVEYKNAVSDKFGEQHAYSDIAFAIFDSGGQRSVMLWKSKNKTFTNKQRLGGDYCWLIYGLEKEALAQAINNKVFDNTAAALISLGAARVAVSF